MKTNFILSVDRLNWSNYKFGVRVSSAEISEIKTIEKKLNLIFKGVEFFWGDRESYYYLCESK